jgi:hypothetical protein
LILFTIILRIVFEYLKLEYYDHYKVYRKAENFFEEVNDSCSDLAFKLYTLYISCAVSNDKNPAAYRMGSVEEMYEENEGLFHDYEPDKNDLPKLHNLCDLQGTYLATIRKSTMRPQGG